MSTSGEEWARQVRDAVIGKAIRERVVFLAATGTMVDVSERVWGRGELTDGSRLRYNEDYEYYGYKPPAPRKPSGKGKPNKDGKARKIKGGYYPTYMAFKEAMGRAEVPFELSGDMRLSWFGGTTPTPTETGPMSCAIVMSAKEAAKADGLAATKGEFLAFSADEVDGFARRVQALMEK